MLYGKLRPYLDKAVLADCDGVCTTELIVLRPRADIGSRYLACLVHSPDFIRHAVAGTTGAHHPRTSWHHIREFELPDFTAGEREAIASLAWTVHEALLRAERATAAAETLKQVAMREVFTRGLRGVAQQELEFGKAPESWRLALLNEVAEVQTGAAKGRKFVDTDVVDVPYLRVANVQDGHLNLSKMKVLRIRRSEIERYRLHEGDVVLTEGGDFDKLGRGFIWRAELPLCIHQNHVFAVRTDRTVLDPEFFAYLAQSPYGKAYFLQVAHKTTNLACINSNKLKAFPVVLPDLEEQRDMVNILKAINQKTDIHRKAHGILEELFTSLLHKLMTGEIQVADLDLPGLETVTAVQVSA